MNELMHLHESQVTPGQIDTLGHMNVRYYVERMIRANEKLLSKLGVALAEGQVLRRTDTYTRFLREQFEGATLCTLGGLIADQDAFGTAGIHAYFEIRNTGTDDVAACFIVTSNVVDDATRQVVRPDLPTAEQVAALGVEVPAYGRPRTLTLAAPAAVAFDDLAAFISEHEQPGSMYGRREGTVLAVDCDEKGRLREEIDPMYVMYRPTEEAAPDGEGPPILRDAQGRRYSWAVMENRSVLWVRPMAGDPLVSLSGDLAYGEKWRLTRRWIFNRDTRELLGVSDHVALCMDLDARQAIVIPPEELQAIAANVLSQFG